MKPENDIGKLEKMGSGDSGGPMWHIVNDTEAYLVANIAEIGGLINPYTTGTTAQTIEDELDGYFIGL